MVQRVAKTQVDQIDSGDELLSGISSRHRLGQFGGKGKDVGFWLWPKLFSFSPQFPAQLEGIFSIREEVRVGLVWLSGWVVAKIVLFHRRPTDLTATAKNFSIEDL